MATSKITVSQYTGGPNNGVSIDQSTATYFLKLAVAAGDYQPGGIPFSFGSSVIAPGAPVQVSIQSVAVPALGYTYKYNPNAKWVGVITNLVLTSNVVTITANNNFAAGDKVLLSGLTTSTFLNAQTVTVISTGLSATQFEFNFTHGNVSTGAETGTAAKQGVGGLADASTGGLMVFTGGTEQATGATPAAIVGDTILCVARFVR